MHFEKEEKKPQKPIQITLACSDGDLHLANLSPEELEIIRAMFLGHYWVSIKDGRLVMVHSREEIPGPVQDEEMYPFWKRSIPGQKQLQLFDVEMAEPEFPRIIIQHLCGYGYTPERYRDQVRILESYGFECLRSRRGDDAKFDEIWYLCGLWAAKGKLEEELKSFDYTSKKSLDAAIRFLCRNVSFGTLEVAFQRAAMVLD